MFQFVFCISHRCSVSSVPLCELLNSDMADFPAERTGSAVTMRLVSSLFPCSYTHKDFCRCRCSGGFNNSNNSFSLNTLFAGSTSLPGFCFPHSSMIPRAFRTTNVHNYIFHHKLCVRLYPFSLPRYVCRFLTEEYTSLKSSDTQ